MVFPGFGVNYFQSTIAAGIIPFFQEIGLNYVRPFIPASVYPYNQSPNAGWRNQVKQWMDNGFYCSWGTSSFGSNISASSWPNLASAIQSEAMQCMAQGIIPSDFELGNELELACTASIVFLQQSGGTAQATTSGAHNFQTGESVTIYGANPSGYNGTYTVTVLNSTNFTFSVSAGLAQYATSNGSCYSITQAQIRANLRALATSIKAAGYPGKLSVAVECEGSAQNGAVHGSSGFIADGSLGDIDLMSIHPYLDYSTPGGVPTLSLTSAKAFITAAFNAYGSNAYISEFNLNGSAANMNTLPPLYQAQIMQQYATFIAASGMFAAMGFYWSSGGTGSSQDFTMGLMPQGNMSPMWNTFFTSNPTIFTKGRSVSAGRDVSAVRGSSVTRPASMIRPGFNPT